MTISVKTKDGNERRVVMRQGNEMGAGAKHSLFRHFGTGVGVITSDDIISIPDVIANGVRTEKQRGSTRLAEYKLTDRNGDEFTVLTEIKKGKEIFNDFYSNKKAPLSGTFNTQSAHTANNNALSADKGSDNSLNTQEGETRFRTVEEVSRKAAEKQEEKRRVPLRARTQEWAEKLGVPLRARAQEWAEKLGVPVKMHESIEMVTNREAKRRLENDDDIDGWFNVADGSVEIYLPNVKDVAQVDNVYLHEVVGHKGLREVMGKKFDALCDSAWNVMDAGAQKHFLEYVGAVDENGMVLENPSLKQMRDAADEYMAWMAQNVAYEVFLYWLLLTMLFLCR